MPSIVHRSFSIKFIQDIETFHLDSKFTHVLYLEWASD